MRADRADLEQCWRGRVGFVGLGASDRGDDAVGCCLAERFERTLRRPGSGPVRAGSWVVRAGVELERWSAALSRRDWDQLVLLDAVDFGASPGSVVLLGAGEIAARFPQVSTHQLSLGTWARWLEGDGRRRVWLLGVQPASLRAGEGLSAPVADTVACLARWFEEGS